MVKYVSGARLTKRTYRGFEWLRARVAVNGENVVVGDGDEFRNVKAAMKARCKTTVMNEGLSDEFFVCENTGNVS